MDVFLPKKLKLASKYSVIVDRKSEFSFARKWYSSISVTKSSHPLKACEFTLRNLSINQREGKKKILTLLGSYLAFSPKHLHSTIYLPKTSVTKDVFSCSRILYISSSWSRQSLNSAIGVNSSGCWNTNSRISASHFWNSKDWIQNSLYLWNPLEFVLYAFANHWPHLQVADWKIPLT